MPGTPPLLLLHGFPSSSYDWKPLLEQLPGRDVLAFDFLGFGLSDKPRDHTYTLAWQADLAEELVKRHLPDRPLMLVAHDMGTSVSTELFAREIEGRPGIEFAGALLFNGSMVTERATLTRSQKALLSPLGALFTRLSNRRLFGREFGEVFSPSHPLSKEEADDQWSLICHNGGRTLGHKTIHYVTERRRLHDRWHGAISNWPGRLSLAWGELDPVATTSGPRRGNRPAPRGARRKAARPRPLRPDRGSGGDRRRDSPKQSAVQVPPESSGPAGSSRSSTP